MSRRRLEGLAVFACFVTAIATAAAAVFDAGTPLLLLSLVGYLVAMFTWAVFT